MKKTVLIIGALLAVVLFSVFALPKLTGNTINNSQSSSSIVSISELSKHNSASDCWVAYGNEVYDITTYLPNHPGSPQAIMPYCGTSDNFENAFNTKHGVDNSYKIPKVGTFKGNLN